MNGFRGDGTTACNSPVKRVLMSSADIYMNIQDLVPKITSNILSNIAE